MTTENASPRISDDAVQEKTGKRWEEWFAILDDAGATGMTHQEIVAHLDEVHRISPWWQQTVTNAYERARGMREKHEMPAGFEISRSRTIDVPVERLYAAWVDEGQRARWLDHDVEEVRETTPGSSVWMDWPDGTRVNARFYEKGDDKSQVTVQHTKLPDGDAAVDMKAFWSKRLATLKQRLEQ